MRFRSISNPIDIIGHEQRIYLDLYHIIGFFGRMVKAPPPPDAQRTGPTKLIPALIASSKNCSAFTLGGNSSHNTEPPTGLEVRVLSTVFEGLIIDGTIVIGTLFVLAGTLFVLYTRDPAVDSQHLMASDAKS